MDKNSELKKLMATKMLDLAEKLFVARISLYWEQGGSDPTEKAADWFNECLELAKIAVGEEANSDPI